MKLRAEIPSAAQQLVALQKLKSAFRSTEVPEESSADLEGDPGGEAEGVEEQGEARGCLRPGDESWDEH